MMNRIELLFMRCYAKLGRLPLAVRTWIGRHAWWIVLVVAISGVALSVTTGLMLLLLGTLGGAVLVAVTLAVFLSMLWLHLLLLVMSLLVAITCCILLFVAVTPLRQQRYAGWRLLFGAWLILLTSQVVIGIVSILFLSDSSVVISGLIEMAFTVLFGYVLFDIRDQFTVRPVVAADEATAVV